MAKTTKSIIIADIDWSISIPRKERMQFLDSPNPDWNKFYEDSFNDQPIWSMIHLLRTLSNHYHVYFLTGRSEIIRKKTEMWLLRYYKEFLNPERLFMRKIGDHRPNHLVKRDMILNHFDKEKILFAIDDEEEVLVEYAKLGISTLTVLHKHGQGEDTFLVKKN